MNSYLKTVLIIMAGGLIVYALSKTAFIKSWLKQWEGFSPTPYKDGDGYSIGYGHQILPGEPYWPYGTIKEISEPEASALLDQDMNKARAAVLSYTRVPLSSSQLDALTSFVYNIGTNAFSNSTLLKKLNAGDYSGALAEFTRWNKSDGAVNAGLVARRAEEQKLFAS